MWMKLLVKDDVSLCWGRLGYRWKFPVRSAENLFGRRNAFWMSRRPTKSERKLQEIVVMQWIFRYSSQKVLAKTTNECTLAKMDLWNTAMRDGHMTPFRRSRKTHLWLRESGSPMCKGNSSNCSEVFRDVRAVANIALKNARDVSTFNHTMKMRQNASA